MLSHESRQPAPEGPVTNLPQEQACGRQYPTRRSMPASTPAEHRYATHVSNKDAGSSHITTSQPPPAGLAPKNVTFELHFDGTPNVRGRLPMRVQIFPHDNTESIVMTVKNFYGLYDGASQGVTFEDVAGNALVANYDNFVNDMVIYVRVVPEYVQRQEYQGQWGYNSTSPQAYEELQPMLPPQPAQILNYGQLPSRPESRISRKQSASPKLGQGRAGSTQMARSRSGIKSQRSSFQAALDELNSDTHNGYSSSDGGAAGSVTSSRKARSEQLASAEISVDNIVEGGRRKRAKFESSVSAIRDPQANGTANAGLRNCHFSSHPRFLRRIPYHQSHLNAAQMAPMSFLLFHDRHNAHSRTTYHSNHRKNTQAMDNHIAPLSQARGSPFLPCLTTATGFAIARAVHRYPLAHL